ncbi:MAG: leucine-rich repeat protein [Firmicutes bacterium]|nr:leucine-rich repeat protein [Bacillota bacterium]
MKKLPKHNKILVIIIIALLATIGLVTLSACSGCSEETYEPPQEFSLTFNSNGGSLVAATTVTEGQPLTLLPVPTREGHNFLGWFSDAEFTQLAYAPLNLTANTTLFARWDGVNTISFNTMGGSSVESISALTGTHLTAPTSPTRAGYRFGGWYEDEAITRSSEFYFGRRMPGGDVTLFARWDRLVRFSFVGATATLELEDGTVLDPASHHYLVAGDFINRPQPEPRTGYAFVGWFMQEDSELPLGWPSFLPSGGVTIYARWRSVVRTITFAGTGTLPVNITTGINEGDVVDLSNRVATITATSHPTLYSYYFFNGWTDQYGRVHTSSVTLGASSLTLTANWVRSALYARIVFSVASPHDREMPTRDYVRYIRKLSTYNLYENMFAPLTAGQTLTGLDFEFVGVNDYIFHRTHQGNVIRDLQIIADTSITLTFFHSGTEGLAFTNVSGELMVIGFTNPATAPTTLVIPAIHNGMWVRAIADEAFRNLNLTAVTFPEGIRVLGYSAFESNNINTTIRIPSTIVLISHGVFFGNVGLTRARITFAGLDNLTFMGTEVFGGTAFATETATQEFVTLPCVDGFYILYMQRTQQANPTLPNNTRFIANNIFFGNQYIRNVFIPDSVRAIGNGAFANTLVEEVRLPIGLRTIAPHFFTNATNLHTVNIPASVIYIGHNAFRNTAISSIAIPNVRHIGAEAFRGSSINEVQFGGLILGSPLSYLGEGAFRDTPYLFTIDLQVTRITELQPYTFSNSSILTIVRLPNTVREIGAKAFYNSPQLYLVHTGTSTGSALRHIREYAFAGTALRSLVIRTGFVHVPENANLNTFVATQAVNIAPTALPTGRNIRVFVQFGGIVIAGGAPRSQTYVELYTAIFNGLNLDSNITVTPVTLEGPTGFLTGDSVVVMAGEKVHLGEAIRIAVVIEDNVTAFEDMFFIILEVIFDGEVVEPVSINSNYFIFTEAGTYQVLFVGENEFGTRITGSLQFTVVLG